MQRSWPTSLVLIFGKNLLYYLHACSPSRCLTSLNACDL
jgi:hypothetical protein